MYAEADDAKLLEVLIGRRAAQQPAAALADLLEADEQNLCVRGIGIRNRQRLLACAEVARRYQPRTSAKSRVLTPLDALSHLSEIRGRDHEVLAVILLDAQMSRKDFKIIAEGGIAKVATSPREVFAAALRAGASALILAHNHPSESVEPSREDFVFTRTMVEAGRVLSIDVVDHLIVSRRSFYSFRERGML
jgi:DNA repair protein RadC